MVHNWICDGCAVINNGNKFRCACGEFQKLRGNGKLYFWEGEYLPMKELSDKVGINVNTLAARLRRFSLDKSVNFKTTPDEGAV